MTHDLKLEAVNYLYRHLLFDIVHTVSGGQYVLERDQCAAALVFNGPGVSVVVLVSILVSQCHHVRKFPGLGQRSAVDVKLDVVAPLADLVLVLPTGWKFVA